MVTDSFDFDGCVQFWTFDLLDSSVTCSIPVSWGFQFVHMSPQTIRFTHTCEMVYISPAVTYRWRTGNFFRKRWRKICDCLLEHHFSHCLIMSSFRFVVWHVFHQFGLHHSTGVHSEQVNNLETITLQIWHGSRMHSSHTLQIWHGSRMHSSHVGDGTYVT